MGRLVRREAPLFAARGGDEEQDEGPHRGRPVLGARGFGRRRRRGLDGLRPRRSATGERCHSTCTAGWQAQHDPSSTHDRDDGTVDASAADL
mmetsp:Transcript_27533/g.89184  ORF Transcript_27533/g.89184 Transcript_27533/m.89184 type:complete len:92 (+) Transcript_27533:1358-1633(+)